MTSDEDFSQLDDLAFLAERKRVREELERTPTVSDELAARYQRLSDEFIRKKRFSGTHGLDVTRPMQLDIAAQAVALTAQAANLAQYSTNQSSALTSLQASNPEEDWGYFLTQDGKDVRWSDVAISGDSHGASGLRA